LVSGCGDRVLRVAVDGPASTSPGELADDVVSALAVGGRAAAHVRADRFWRDASLRLEQGREDVDAFHSWLDADALRREVLEPVAATGRYLPSLRDPATNRSTREPARVLESPGVLLVSGALLLGRGLPFDRVVSLVMSSGARARHLPGDLAWTLPAYERYDAEVRPAALADVLIKLDDPRRPAVRGLS
jgi:hypothetical protein